MIVGKGRTVSQSRRARRARQLADYAFGTPSYVNPATDCPIDGSWETYCDCMFPPDTADNNERQRCRSKYCPIFNPFNPGDCSADPLKASPPWTEVGAGARNIRKPNAGLFYDVTKAVRVPGIEEYDPENLVKVSLTDVPRYGVLMAYANVVMGNLGTAYMLQFTMIGPPPGALLAQLPAVIALSYARGGWDRVISNIIEPAVNEGGLIASTALDYCFSGNAALFKYAIKKVAQNLQPGSLHKAILEAMVNMTGTVLDGVRDPDKFRDASTIKEFGETLVKVTGPFEPRSDVSQIVWEIGNFMQIFDDAISHLLHGNLQKAADSAFTKVFGKTPTEVANLPMDVRQGWVKATSFNATAALAVGQRMIEEISKALASVNFAGIGQMLANSTKGLDNIFGGIAQEQKNALPPPPPAVTPTVTLGTKPSALTSSPAPAISARDALLMGLMTPSTQITAAALPVRMPLATIATEPGPTPKLNLGPPAANFPPPPPEPKNTFSPPVAPPKSQDLPHDQDEGNPPATDPAKGPSTDFTKPPLFQPPPPSSGVGGALVAAGVGFLVGGPVGAGVGAIASFFLTKKG